MITYNNAIKFIAARASKEIGQSTENVGTLGDLLKEMFNLRYKDFQNRYPWPWRNRTTDLQTIANYDAGQVTVVTDSRSVKGTGTTWTSAMKGRFLKLDGDTEMYEILDVPSGTDLTLRQGYIRPGRTEQYLIWNRYYDLPPAIELQSLITLWQYPYKSIPLPLGDINKALSKGYINGYPDYWAWSNVKKTPTLYTTGTISGAVNTKIITGLGTAWIGNVSEGSTISDGTNTYDIETIDTDTQITTVQKLVKAISASTTYTVTTENRSRIVLSAVPDPRMNFHIDFPVKPYSLKNDNDVMDMWAGFEHVVINAVYAEFLDKLTSERAFAWYSIYNQEVERAWMTICAADPVEYATWVRENKITGYRTALYS